MATATQASNEILIMTHIALHVEFPTETRDIEGLLSKFDGLAPNEINSKDTSVVVLIPSENVAAFEQAVCETPWVSHEISVPMIQFGLNAEFPCADEFDAVAELTRRHKGYIQTTQRNATETPIGAVVSVPSEQVDAFVESVSATPWQATELNY